MDNDTAHSDGVADLPMRLHQFSVAYQGLAAQWVRHLSINAHERQALEHLWESGPMTMSELGDRIPLSRAAVTSLTDRLERLGYVKRTPDSVDRRRTVLSLTPLPQQEVDPVADAFRSDLRELCASMGDEKCGVVLEFLDGVRTLAHQHALDLRRQNAEAGAQRRAQLRS